MRAHREEAAKLRAASREQRFPVGSWVGVKIPTASADLQAHQFVSEFLDVNLSTSDRWPLALSGGRMM